MHPSLPRGRAALLSPFNRRTYDRKHTIEHFEFDYQLERYRPHPRPGRVLATAIRSAGAVSGWSSAMGMGARW
jgi:hypothetical protein